MICEKNLEKIAIDCNWVGKKLIKKFFTTFLSESVVKIWTVHFVDLFYLQHMVKIL